MSHPSLETTAEKLKRQQRQLETIRENDAKRARAIQAESTGKPQPQPRIQRTASKERYRLT